MIGRTISRYRILEKLGEGGMGEVFLAEDTELNRRVALKFLSSEYASDPELLARFRQEAQTAAGLHHPNIITIYEVGQYEDRPFIAMAYVDGETLTRVIERGDLPLAARIDLALQIAAGLGMAHDAGIVHRDIKPDNIFVDKEGRVQILDFGLAKLQGVSRVTGPTSTFGTLNFMSPEQVRGEQVDHRSDIFSFGTVLYELLTGQLPFKGEHSAAVIYSITNEDPAPPSELNPDLPKDLDSIVLGALAKSPAERYQSINELATNLKNYRRGSTLRASQAARPRLARYVVPTSVVFAAVLGLLLLKPFRVEFSPDQNAVAREASLAVMYFDNVADPEDPKRLGEIITNLLITDLSESEYMDVVSSQRLYDILKLEGREGEKQIDQNTASLVASRAGAKWMLLGKILQVEPTIVVTSQLVDVQTGRVASSQRIKGAEGETIFDLVDRLTVEIKDDLTLPDEDKSLDIADATTHSTEAYRAYLEGVENINKYYGQEARACFNRALEYDSTFAMAHLQMAQGIVSPNRAARRRSIAAAMKYSSGVTTKEKLYIQSFDARMRGQNDEALALLQRIVDEYPKEKDAYKAMGDLYRGPLMDPEKAVVQYRKAIEIDPLDKFSYNVLAYTYQALGDIDNYIWAIYQYISLAPDEANPYDSRGDLYAFSGKVDKAIRSYEKALSRKPDFYPSLIKLGEMHVFQQEYDKAKEAFDKLLDAKDPGVRSTGRTLHALIPAYQGRFGEATKMLDAAREADLAEGSEDGSEHELEYKICRDTGQLDRAVELVRSELARYRKTNPDDKLAGRVIEIHVTALSGKIEDAKGLLRSYERAIEDEGQARKDEFIMAEALVSMAEGDYATASTRFDELPVNNPYFFREYHRGLAYVLAGRYIEATKVLEEVTRRFSEDRAFEPVLAVKAYYYLGLAYEESGRPRKALEEYATFLDIWHNADAGLPEIEDARSRVAALQTAGTES